MVFDQILSLTKGGPAQSTESISYLIYKMVWTAVSLGFRAQMQYCFCCHRSHFNFSNDSYGKEGGAVIMQRKKKQIGS